MDGANTRGTRDCRFVRVVRARCWLPKLNSSSKTEPWRQAFFEMSWRRWEFWLFSAVMSWALIPVLEELFFRGYCQRRLAVAWGTYPRSSEQPVSLPSNRPVSNTERVQLRHHCGAFPIGGGLWRRLCLDTFSIPRDHRSHGIRHSHNAKVAGTARARLRYKLLVRLAKRVGRRSERIFDK